MSFKFQCPPARELLILFVCLGIWLAVTAMFIGIRPEHPLLIALIAGLFCAHPQTKKLVVALLPFILFAVSYDWMNIVPNYKVNPIDVQDLYEAEKSLFGITTSEGILTPNEYFARHNIPDLYPCHCVSLKVKHRFMETLNIHEVGVGMELEI